MTEITREQKRIAHNLYQKEWHKKNLEKERKRKALWAREHLECQQNWRKNHPEKVKEYCLKYRTKYAQELARKGSICGSNWRIKNPIGGHTHSKIYRETQHERLTRPDYCSKCGKPCKPDAHHEDYKKPLEITWLCRSCHGLVEVPNETRL